MFKIVHVVGARPNFVKAAPVVFAINELLKEKVNQRIVHTGQHYSKNLSESFFTDLEIPLPDISLSIKKSSRHGEQTASILQQIEVTFLREEPDLLIVYGDVNSTLAATLAASKLGIKIAHIESGLRSFDKTMPEEINRKMVDSISDILFVTEFSGKENLLREGHSPSSIYFVGNTMIDTLSKHLSTIKKSIKLNSKKDFALLTCHRPSNVDSLGGLKKLLELCRATPVDIIMPLHPRTRARMLSFNLLDSFKNLENLQMIEPAPYREFVSLLLRCRFVITDSGGVQEESTYLGVPCLTLRPNTERPSTITSGTNILTSHDNIALNIRCILEGEFKIGTIPPLWDGKASQRIAHNIRDIFSL